MAKMKSNPVAKNINTFNKPATHKDRKQAAKRGYAKHKLMPVPENGKNDIRI
mgnify:FL=1|jgi:hypothetical protein